MENSSNPTSNQRTRGPLIHKTPKWALEFGVQTLQNPKIKTLNLKLSAQALGYFSIYSSFLLPQKDSKSTSFVFKITIRHLENSTTPFESYMDRTFSDYTQNKHPMVIFEQVSPAPSLARFS